MVTSEKIKTFESVMDNYGIQIGNVPCIFHAPTRSRSMTGLMFNACTVIEAELISTSPFIPLLSSRK